MAGLVNYGSSDEEDNAPRPSLPPNASPNAVQTKNIVSNGDGFDTIKDGQDVDIKPLQGPALGPSLGPPIPHEDATSEVLEQDPQRPPQSPYSANRALLQELTLPTFPNYDIPQSPPGSPIESTSTKFKQFLKLKKQGVHFNEKLANSAAMKNPSLMQKLLDFVDIDEIEQYATTLPADLWNPKGFPEYAYKEGLARSQQEIMKRKEEDKSRGQRDSIDFVAASASANASRSGTPSTGSRGGPKSAAERVMAGLDRPSSSSPLVQGVKRKTRFDS